MIDELKKLMSDATDALDEVKRNHHASNGKRIGGAVNWADLKVVCVRRDVELYAGTDDTVDGWSVLIEEAAPGSDELRRYVTLGLIERGHVGVNVETAW